MSKRIISRTAAKRFSTKYIVDAKSGCWLWQASCTDRGYGFFTMYPKQKGRTNAELAHRASWILHVGEIPDGKLVCHHCDTPSCVNPGHLFVGSSQDNNDDMMAKGRSRLIGRPMQDACKRGHILSGTNLVILNTGKRLCRWCRQARDREYKSVQRAGDRGAYNAGMRAYRQKRKSEGRPCPLTRV